MSYRCYARVPSIALGSEIALEVAADSLQAEELRHLNAELGLRPSS